MVNTYYIVHKDGEYIDDIQTVVTDNALISQNSVTKEAYEAVLLAIRNKPAAGVGYDYKLHTDLTWELVELPPAPVAYTQETLGAMTNAALEQILSGFGITANMNKANMIRLILQAQGDESA